MDDKNKELAGTELHLRELKDEIRSSFENVEQTVDATREEETCERKPTQTDHLNKKLLSSFLTRLNNADNTVAFGLQANSSNEDTASREPDHQEFVD